jgi:hypothetical protein
VTTLRTKALAFSPILFLATQFWKPALLDGKTIVHGDSITDGLAFLALQARSFHHLGQLLWADGVYGGHPLFAEGQGAFASPLTLVLAWVVSPLTDAITAMNFGHWLMMILAGAGVVGLTRSLGASLAAASFAGVAVIFSPIWIGSAQNMTIYGALTWVPWAFWALEEWLKRPGIRSAVPLGAAVAMTILSGYPQAFHGAILYMALTLLIVPFHRETRQAWIAEWRVRAGTAVLAVLVCAGLSAIQWVPLLELTSLSHRSGGIGIHFQLPFLPYFRGLLFTWNRIGPAGDYFPGTGSLLVVVLASLAFVVGAPSRIKAHMLAALILVQLGWGEASPLFRLLYRHDLIPGLRYFRTVHIYIEIATIGFAVLAAFAADGLRQLPSPRFLLLQQAERSDVVRFALGAAIVLLWVTAATAVGDTDLRWMNFGATLLAVIVGAVLVLAGRAALLPVLMLVLLVGECMNLRTHMFHFYERSVLAEPASAAAIAAVPGGRDDKLFDASMAGGYGFFDSRNPAIPSLAKRMIEANCAMTNTMWGTRSINGALALPMRRQVVAETRIRDEVTGKAANPTGSRLMDLLAVRFISVDQPAEVMGSALFWSDPALGINVLENSAAQPRFQLYAHHVTVGSLDEALEAIEALKAPTLVIENPPDRPQPEPADEAADNDLPGHFDILKAKSTEYRVDITADRSAWFFVADANYPGWRATLDGKRVPLFSAQLLGKAVAIPQGRHRLEIAFVSSTFIAGLSITVVSVFAVLLVLWAGRRSDLH